MKRILTIVCCSILLLSVSSCTKQYITPNPNETVTATLAPSDWALYNNGESYAAPISVPDLTGDFAKFGGIIVAISYGNDVYEQIPEVYNGVSYSYTYNNGNVTLFGQSPDGNTPLAPTQSIKVKITLVSTE